MTHELSSQAISYMRGELSPMEEVRFEQALRESAELRAELEAVRTTFSLLGDSMPDVEPAMSLREAFRDRLLAEPQERIPRPSIPELVHELGPRTRRRRLATVLAVAASIFIAVVIVVSRTDPPPPVDGPAVASLIRSRGDVLVSSLGNPEVAGWRVSSAGGEAPVLRVNQRVATGEDASATLSLPDRSTVWLAADTSLALVGSGVTGRGERVQVERGRVSFDVTSRAAESRTDSPPPQPFVVLTPQGEIRVRGTRFVVDVKPDVSLVVVFEGRVDVLAGEADLSGRQAAVRPGWFAAFGTGEALDGLLPDDAAAMFDTPGDLPLPRTEGPIQLVTRPLVRVSLELSHLEVSSAQGNHARGKVTLTNVSPFTLQLDHEHNRDNVKLQFTAPGPSEPGWAPVAPVSLRLQSGADSWYEVGLERVLFHQRFGTWYLGAVYEGPVGLVGLAHPDLAEPAWTTVDCLSESPRHSVLYLPPPDDGSAPGGNGNGEGGNAGSDTPDETPDGPGSGDDHDDENGTGD